MTMGRADEELLHRHLNGDLDAADEAAFLARLQESPDLMRALAARTLDETLISDLVREGRVQAPRRTRTGWPAMAAAALMLVGLGLTLLLGRPQPPPPAATPAKPDAEAKADEAVLRACRYLESRRAEIFAEVADGKRHGPAPRRTYAELAALALIRAGRAESDPFVEELIGRALGRPLESTYVAAIRATLLSEVNPRPDRLRQCAQFLVDSQCANGQWDYGRALKFDDMAPAGVIRRRQDGPATGDNSVSGYAIQGLLACMRAGVRVEPDVLARARRWWLSCQNADGGWGYRDALQPDRGTPNAAATSDASYGSATASGVASLAALRTMLGADPASDEAIRRGSDWLAQNFTAETNPKKSPVFSHVHWLVAAEHAGVLLGVDRFGDHDWYAEGSRHLRGRQKAAGEWSIEGEFMKGEKNDVVDTCLAILFLTRK